MVVLGTAAGLLLLHLALALRGQKPGPSRSFLLALDAVVLVVACLRRTLEAPDGGASSRGLMTFVPLLLGQLLFALCFVSGGLASPYFLLVLTTCVFAALTLPPTVAMLL